MWGVVIGVHTGHLAISIALGTALGTAFGALAQSIKGNKPPGLKAKVTRLAVLPRA
jgi:hypothetical protein